MDTVADLIARRPAPATRRNVVDWTCRQSHASEKSSLVHPPLACSPPLSAPRHTKLSSTTQSTCQPRRDLSCALRPRASPNLSHSTRLESLSIMSLEHKVREMLGLGDVRTTPPLLVQSPGGSSEGAGANKSRLKTTGRRRTPSVRRGCRGQTPGPVSNRGQLPHHAGPQDQLRVSDTRSGRRCGGLIRVHCSRLVLLV